MKKIKSSEITPEHTYLNRREFLKAMGIVSASSAVLAACAPQTTPTSQSGATDDAGDERSGSSEAVLADNDGDATIPTGSYEDNLGDPANTYTEVTNYNNYYEFTVRKEDVAGMASTFKTSPWTVQVGGLVRNKKMMDIDDLKKKFDLEERTYRLRCVEGWSMVIPWVGFPISKLIDLVEPESNAKYIRFETLHDPTRMPGQKVAWYQWPYVEGLRMDEAMNDLAFLATGLYGQELPAQNGAPLRLVVPWKYGFKSIKAITKIEFVEEMPQSLWMAAASNEYGFYANVNPEVSHPRWSQSSERRIGELGRRQTLKFNGYEEEVAYLYDGMDLEKNY